MNLSIKQILNIFSIKFPNILPMYIEVGSDADTDLDISIIHFIDDMTALYPTTGKLKSCSFIIDVKSDKIILVLDPLFTLHVDVPLIEYDRDAILEDLIDEVSTQISNKLQLQYEISIEEFITTHTKLKLEAH